MRIFYQILIIVFCLILIVVKCFIEYSIGKNIYEYIEKLRSKRIAQSGDSFTVTTIKKKLHIKKGSCKCKKRSCGFIKFFNIYIGLCDYAKRTLYAKSEEL